MIIHKQHLTLLLSVESPFFRMNDKFPCCPCDVMKLYEKISRGECKSPQGL